MVHALLVGGFIIFLLFSFSAVALAIIFRNLPQPEELHTSRINQSTKIYDRTGEVLLYEVHGEEKRTIIPYENIPDAVKEATIAIEDQNFYEHPAFDIRAILRAIVKDLLNLGFEQGASTITQQLAKNAYLSPEKKISRKIKELLLALRLERQFTKDEILHLYLNQIPYGSNAYGIEAAAQTYFDKSAQELTLAEGALLASLPKAPSYYFAHKNELLERKDFTLEAMYKLGFITEAERDVAKEEKLTFAPLTTTIKAPHFVMAVQEYLAGKYGIDTLENGGLRVYTTIDWRLQQIAEDVVYRGVERNTELYKGRNGALVAEDPKTGQVLTLVGSKDYFDIENEGNFNVAMQGLRQPGSAFKPFAYLTAFQKGYTPETIVFDVETEFDTTGIPERSYKPGNFDPVFRGPVALRTALAQSINIPAVKVMYLAGIDDVLKTAELFGLTTLTERSRYGLSLVLGGGEVRLSELVNAYAVFANDGKKNKQTLITRVEDDKGEVLEEYEEQTTQIIEPQYVRLINNVLSDTKERSGLFGGSLNLTIFPGYEVALKTGTTNNFVDAWSIGYTPNLVVGVWAGNNHREPLQKSGGSILAAVPMWSEFMREALKDTEPEFFVQPDPYTATKPVLRGDYAYQKQIHNILYYVRKNDPQGPAPLRPEDDPQFWNWEFPVLKWAERNVADFAGYNKGVYNAEENTDVEITIREPQNGSYAQNTLNLNFDILSNRSLVRVEVLWNDVRIDEVAIQAVPFSYQKQHTFEPSDLKLQNKLSVRAVSSEGAAYQKDVVVYK